MHPFLEKYVLNGLSVDMHNLCRPAAWFAQCKSLPDSFLDNDAGTYNSEESKRKGVRKSQSEAMQELVDVVRTSLAFAVASPSVTILQGQLQDTCRKQVVLARCLHYNLVYHGMCR